MDASNIKKTVAMADLVGIKQEPGIKLEPDDVDTIEYTRTFNLNEVFTPKVEKIESEEDEVVRQQGSGDLNGIAALPGIKLNAAAVVPKQTSTSFDNTTHEARRVAPTTRKQHKCNECGYVTPWSSHLIAHMLKHTGEKPFPCNHCPKRFTSKRNLQSHRKVHVTKDSLNCSICLQIFATENELLDHESTCKQRRYECHLCKKFSSSLISNLKRHMQGHSGVRPNKCDKCTMEFTRKHNLERHLRTHANPRPLKFPCTVCARNFVKQCERNAHEMNCKRRRYECYLCQKYTTHLKPHLQRHIRLHHTGEKPFKCNLCEKCYADGSRLRPHMKINHNQKLSC